MFNFYQNFNLKRTGELEAQRDADVTGHDRFCQQHPGSTSRRKNRAANNRRTQSAIEIDCNDTFASVRSVLLRKEKSASVEDEHVEDEDKGYSQLASKLDSLAKLFFNRIYSVKGQKTKGNDTRNHQYVALDQQQQLQPHSTPSDESLECLEMEKRSRDRALSICRIYTRDTPRYSLLKHLQNVGSRVEKHWFFVKDNLLKTDRLLTLAPLNRNCTLKICPASRDVLDKIFLSLQHPYVCPILNVEFLNFENQDYVILVIPINQGSLKDMIYGVERNYWNEEWALKYESRGKGLTLPQIQRMGRQILEALLFLKERGFPMVTNLHSGNVIVQNGVARLAGLENTLLGFTSRIHPIILSRLQSKTQSSRSVPNSIDVICFGHMLFEMCAGYEMCTFEPTSLNLADLDKYPQVVGCLNFIFDRCIHGLRYPTVEELLLHDLFRNIDLREMRSASVTIFRPETTVPISSLIEEIKRHKTPVRRMPKVDSEDTPFLGSPESERNDNTSLLAQMYKELAITAV